MIWEQDLAEELGLKLQTIRKWRKKMDKGKHWTKETGFAAKVHYTELGAEIIKEIRDSKVAHGDLKPTELPCLEYAIKFTRFSNNKRIILGYFNGNETKKVRVIVKPNEIKFLKPGRSWIKARHMEDDLFTMFGVNQRLTKQEERELNDLISR